MSFLPLSRKVPIAGRTDAPLRSPAFGLAILAELVRNRIVVLLVEQGVDFGADYSADVKDGHLVIALTFYVYINERSDGGFALWIFPLGALLGERSLNGLWPQLVDFEGVGFLFRELQAWIQI